MDHDIYAIQRAFPRIWHACHRRHRRGATDASAPSERDIAILAHLDPDRPTTAGRLARHLGIGPSTLSEAVDQLERHGYLTRTRRAPDRRVVELCISKKGQAAVSSGGALDPGLLRELLARLGDADRRAAVAGLEILARATAPRRAAPKGARRKTS
jgi:DNA-binding MarR family transcriptional regulator